MDNKERNKIILEIVCDLMANLNQEVQNAYVEDIESEENQVLVGIEVANPGSLIGVRGRNMAALQTVVSLMVKNKFNEWIRVLLDVNNYRSEQKERLQNNAKELAAKVLETGKSIEMIPMSSYERRLCHMVLTEIEGIESESEGEGEMRHIVIKAKA